MHPSLDKSIPNVQSKTFFEASAYRSFATNRLIQQYDHSCLFVGLRFTSLMPDYNPLPPNVKPSPQRPWQLTTRLLHNNPDRCRVARNLVHRSFFNLRGNLRSRCR